MPKKVLTGKSLIEKEVDEFTNSIKKGPLKSAHQKQEISETLIWKSCYQAYLDASRTFRGIGKEVLNVEKENNYSTDKLSDSVFKELVREIYDFFADSKDFTHAEYCKIVTNSFKNKGTHTTYGQAQKIVNMTFKYLYCFLDRDKYKNKFDNCDIALDRFTLIWYAQKSGYWFEGWSNLDSEKLYNKIQKDYKNIINKEFSGQYSAIEAEFIIWSNSKEKYYDFNSFDDRLINVIFAKEY